MLAIVLLAAQAASPTWAPMNKIGLATDGYVVTLSGDGKTMSVGDAVNNANAGRVRVYTRAGGTWQEQWTKFGNDITGAADERFGYSLTLSNDGKTLAISGMGVDSMVRVYKRNTDSYGQIGGDLSTNPSDGFGFSVTLSGDGNTLAVGAPFATNSGGQPNAGVVHVYKRAGNSWTEIGELSGTAANEKVGWSISLNDDGTTLAVGAPYTTNPTANAGLVRVYTRAGDAWTKSGDDINGDAVEDEFGYSVSLSGDGQTLAVGGRYNSANAGHARVYARDGDTWNTINTIAGPAGSHFGTSISLSNDGQTLAVGGPKATVDGNALAGTVRVYKRNGNAWAESGRFDGATAGDQLGPFNGVSLSANGETVAIGVSGTNIAQVHEYRMPVPYAPPKPAAGCSDQCVGGYAATPYDGAGLKDFGAQFATMFQRVKHLSQFHCTAPGLSQITTVAECTAAAQLVGQSKSDAVSTEFPICASGSLRNIANDGDYAHTASFFEVVTDDATVLCHCRPCDEPSTSLQSPWWTALGVTAGATGALVPIGIASRQDA